MGAYLDSICASPSPSPSPSAGHVLCDGMPEGDYCDCSGDCMGHPELCACEAARACCEAHHLLSPPMHSPGPFHSPQPGQQMTHHFLLPELEQGRRLQDPFHSPQPMHSPGPFHSPQPMHSPPPMHSPSAGHVLCDGMPEGDYCDCSGDCMGHPEFCACEAARACCEAHHLLSPPMHSPGPFHSSQPGHSPGPFHSPPPGHTHEAFPSPQPGHSPGPSHLPPPWQQMPSPSPSPEERPPLPAMEFKMTLTFAGTVEQFDKDMYMYEHGLRDLLSCQEPLCKVAVVVTAASVNVEATVTDTTGNAAGKAEELAALPKEELQTRMQIFVPGAVVESTVIIFAPPPPLLPPQPPPLPSPPLASSPPSAPAPLDILPGSLRAAAIADCERAWQSGECNSDGCFGSAPEGGRSLQQDGAPQGGPTQGGGPQGGGPQGGGPQGPFPSPQPGHSPGPFHSPQPGQQMPSPSPLQDGAPPGDGGLPPGGGGPPQDGAPQGGPPPDYESICTPVAGNEMCCPVKHHMCSALLALPTMPTTAARQLSAHDYGTVHRPRFDALQQELGANAGAGATVDLVVARSHEDSSWLVDVERELPMVRVFVYEKGGGESVCHTMRLRRATCVPLANVGREQHSFMTHLIEHHDQLADKVVFAQAGPPGNGFISGHQGGHLMPGSDFFYDYLSPLTPPRMVFTMAYANLPNRELLIRRSGFPFNDPHFVTTETAAPAACAADWLTMSNGTKRFWDVIHPRKPEIDLPDQLAYWRAHLQPQLGPMTDAFMPFTNGAVASASGALLAARPKAFYEQLRRTVSTGDTPDAIIYLEMAWAYVVGHADLARACSRQIAAHVEVGGTAAARKLV